MVLSGLKLSGFKTIVMVFSERRYMSSPVHLSVVCLSVVCNVRAPYSGD